VQHQRGAVQRPGLLHRIFRQLVQQQRARPLRARQVLSQPQRYHMRRRAGFSAFPSSNRPAMPSHPPAALVQTQRDARGVLRITLNDPQRFNALGDDMLAALLHALQGAGDDAALRAVVLGGAGRAFCAGHNLKDMAARAQLDYYQQLFAQCSQVMLALHRLPVPVIARVHGIATAAGCQLVAQCDLAVASADARFATSGIHYGLFCATPSVPLVRAVPLKAAMHMLLTGDFIDAQQALAWGLINEVAADAGAALDACVEHLVQSIVEKPRAALAGGKALVYRQREMGLEAAYQLACQSMALGMMDAAAQEGARAFAQKRQPAWKQAGAPSR